MLDPEEDRVAILDHEPVDHDFPPRVVLKGERGGWEVRQLEVADRTMDRLLTATITPKGQDYLHRNLWEKATP